MRAWTWWLKLFNPRRQRRNRIEYVVLDGKELLEDIEPKPKSSKHVPCDPPVPDYVPKNKGRSR